METSPPPMTSLGPPLGEPLGPSGRSSGGSQERVHRRSLPPGRSSWETPRDYLGRTPPGVLWDPWDPQVDSLGVPQGLPGVPQGRSPGTLLETLWGPPECLPGIPGIPWDPPGTS